MAVTDLRHLADSPKCLDFADTIATRSSQSQAHHEVLTCVDDDECCVFDDI
jgi:hypothetical protein